MHRQHPFRRHFPLQRGAALLMFLVLLVVAGLAYVVNNLTPEAMKARQERLTQEAMAQAKDALIGYALLHRERKAAQDPPVLDAVYGYQLMPDLGETVNQNAALGLCATEGCSKFNNSGVTTGATYVGHFPWQTLGTGPLRDGNGNCLWYAVSGTHQALENNATMNWDTLGLIDPVAVNNSAALGNRTGHDAPVAMIFAPGPATATARPVTPNTQCGGDYTVSRYLDASNARGLAITSNDVFAAVRKSSYFRTDINSMLDQMAVCVRDRIAGGNITANGKIDDACSIALDTFGPPGYYKNYRDQAFVATCPACDVNVDGVSVPNCSGALLFANQRGTGQSRIDDTEKATWNNYLENHKADDPKEGNLESFSTAGSIYRGPSKLGPVKASKSNPADVLRCAPGGSFWSLAAACQTVDQDIVRCIPAGPSQTTVSPDLSAIFPGVTTLASYQPTSRQLTLGASDVGLSSTAPNAGKLFACSWQAEPHARGGGFRSYFRFKILDTGDGFTFAIVDANRNNDITNRCGAARQHLGYSGNNGITQPIEHPKIAIEFDTSRNFYSISPTGYLESANPLTNGRNDPDYTPPYDNDGHVAIMYWGYEQANIGAGVTQPGQDDNVHGFPLSADPLARPAPRNATAVLPHPFPPPYPPLGIAPVDRLRDSTTANRDFHVRVEVTPQSRSAEDESLKRRQWKIEAWIEPTDAKAITSLSWSPNDPFNPTNGTVTVTAPGHSFSNGDTILIREAPGNFDGDYVIKNSNTALGTFQFDKFPDPGSTILLSQAVAMKLTEQVARMRMLSLPMASLSPAVKFNSCTGDADCASGQSCIGADQSGIRYCYSGHLPTVYDLPVIYDPDLGGGLYHDALQSIQLGFTVGIGSSDQVIDISEFHTQWLP